MVTTATTLALLAVGTAAAGGVMSYQSGIASAKSGQAIALANAQSSTAAARRAGQMGQMQAQLEIMKSGKEKEAAYGNAKGMRDQAESERRAAQENIRRKRFDYERQRASMRASIAARGVVDTTGSPLEILVNQAEDEALSLSEMAHDANLKQGQQYRAAALEQYGGDLTGLDVGMSLLRKAASDNAAQNQVTQARIDSSAAKIIAANQRRSAQAGLVSDLGSTATSGYNLYNSTPRK